MEEPQHPNNLNDEPLKVLVHNVSHCDLCLILEPHGMARPRSSRYKAVCDEITNVIKEGAKYNGIAYKDHQGNDRYVGIKFSKKQLLSNCAWSDFRLRNSAKTSP